MWVEDSDYAESGVDGAYIRLSTLGVSTQGGRRGGTSAAISPELFNKTHLSSTRPYREPLSRTP